MKQLTLNTFIYALNLSLPLKYLYTLGLFTRLMSFYALQNDQCETNGKESTHNAGDPGSIPGLGRFPGEGNDNPLQYSCLENSMDGGAWWTTVHGVANSHTQLTSLDFTLPCCSGPQR